MLLWVGLLENMEQDASLYYYAPDKDLANIVNSSKSAIYATPYATIPHKIIEGKVSVYRFREVDTELKIFGNHNLANLAAAKLACLELGVTEGQFWEAAATFTGAAKRLQNLVAGEKFSAWLDFAHAPSKAKATVEAVRGINPERKLIACLELHTFSSLNKAFLPHYKNTLAPAESVAVIRML